MGPRPTSPGPTSPLPPSISIISAPWERRAVRVCPSLNTYPYEALTESQPLYENKKPTGKRANPVPGLTRAIAPTQYQGWPVPRASPPLRPKALILEAPLVTNQLV